MWWNCVNVISYQGLSCHLILSTLIRYDLLCYSRMAWDLVRLFVDLGGSASWLILQCFLGHESAVAMDHQESRIIIGMASTLSGPKEMSLGENILKYRDHYPRPVLAFGYCFVYAPSQWETTLKCNIVSHWLGTFTKSSLDAFSVLQGS